MKPMPYGALAIAGAFGTWMLGTYSVQHEVSQLFDVVTGALGLATIICAVLWWRSRAQGNRIPRR